MRLRKSPYLSLLVALALAGCTGADKTEKDARNRDSQPGDTGAQADEDRDGDGFSTNAGDCDDADASAYPGATDAATDGADEDCDGVDGPDADGDGHADAATGGDDCDDADASASPDADEIWDDGADQDCDGFADVEDARCEALLTAP